MISRRQLSRFALVASLAAVAACSTPPTHSDGATRAAAIRSARASGGSFPWKGFDWAPTQGGMAGQAAGDPANVVIAADGSLHLKITKTGATWTAAEVFTTTSLGFGTYQWQIDGPIDRMDHTVVLGLYPYGPAAGMGGDGTNEIDTEFSFWNDELQNVNFDWGVYPPTASGNHWEKDLLFSLEGGSATTARLVWSKTGITGTLMSGFQSITSTQDVLLTVDYHPANPSTDVPQVALPLGMNLWCYNGFPSSGQDVDIAIRDFVFVPEGETPPPDDAGSGPGDDAGEPADSGTPAPPTGDDASSGDAAPAAGGPREDGGGSGRGGAGANGASGSGASGCGVSPLDVDFDSRALPIAAFALAALVLRGRRRGHAAASNQRETDDPHAQSRVSKQGMPRSRR